MIKERIFSDSGLKVFTLVLGGVLVILIRLMFDDVFRDETIYDKSILTLVLWLFLNASIISILSLIRCYLKKKGRI